VAVLAVCALPVGWLLWCLHLIHLDHRREVVARLQQELDIQAPGQFICFLTNKVRQSTVYDTAWIDTPVDDDGMRSTARAIIQEEAQMTLRLCEKHLPYRLDVEVLQPAAPLMVRIFHSISHVCFEPIDL